MKKVFDQLLLCCLIFLTVLGLLFIPSRTVFAAGFMVDFQIPNSSVAGYIDIRSPRGIDIDSNDNVYISDYDLKLIYKLNSSYELLTTFGNTGDNQLVQPGAIAVDSTNQKVFIADYNQGVKVYTLDGNYITNISNDIWPRDVAIYQDSVYVLLNDSIKKYNQSYQLLETVTLEVSYNYKMDFDSSGNIITICDSDYYCKYDSTGTLLGKWGGYGSGNLQFNDPSDITVVNISGQDYVYIVDNNNNRIQKLTTSGTFVSKWGTYGQENGQFSWPEAIAVDSTNNIYITERKTSSSRYNNRRIQKFNSSGTYLASFGSSGDIFGLLSIPISVDTDSQGNIYVLDKANGKVQIYNTNGVYQSKWGEFGIEDGNFSPYVVDYIEFGVDKMSILEDVVYISDGDYDWNILRLQTFSLAGDFLSSWGTTDDFSMNFTSVKHQNFFYTIEKDLFRFSGNKLSKFNLSGSLIDTIGSFGTGDGQFKNSQDIAVSSGSYLYIIDQDNNRVQVFDTNLDHQFKWGSSGTGDGQFAYPKGLDIDSLDNVYVADTKNNRIQKFDSTGNFLLKYGTYGIDSGQFNSPRDLKVLADGSWLVVDTNNSRVQKIVYDEVAPTISAEIESITNSPTVQGTVTDSWGNITSIKYQLNGTEGNWLDCTADDDSFDETSEAFTCDIDTTGLADGEHTVYLRTTDSNSNTTADGSETSNIFTFDTTAPSGGLVSVNSGDSSTNSRNTTLTLSASDATTSVSQMMISESASFSGDRYPLFRAKCAYLL